MASAFSHAVVALVIGQASSHRAMPARFWLLSIACSILPDADVLGFWFGIQYGDLFGHRGLSHSLSFALVLSLIVVWRWFPEAIQDSPRWWLLFAHFFLVTVSHGLLDAMTDGGLGVAFFAPFENTRYFLPWRPVKVSPIGLMNFFNRYGVDVMISEILWIWIPAGLLLLCVTAFKNLARRGL